MTRHRGQGIAVLVGVIYLSLSASTLLISLGLAPQTHDPSHMIPALTEALKVADYGVHSTAAVALGRIGPAAVPVLIEALKDPDDNIRYMAAVDLGSIGPAAIPALIEALTDANPNVRERAATALGEIGPAASTALPALIEALTDVDPDVGERAAQALAMIAHAARDARATQMISALKAAHQALLAVPDLTIGEYATTVSGVIEFLELF